jgi:hypothetical protein
MGAALCALVAFLGFLLVSPSFLVSNATFFLLAGFVAFCLLFPARFAALFICVGFGIDLIAGMINDNKIALTQFPLTLLDIQITAANPAGLLMALGVPLELRGLLLVVALCALVLFAASAIFACRSLVLEIVSEVRSGGHGWAHAGLAALILVASAAGLARFASDYPVAVAADGLDAYSPDRAVNLANKTGTIPFLLYSFLIDASGSGNALLKPSIVPPASDEEIVDSASRFVTPRSASFDQLPNIVVLMGESTFDVDAEFNVEPPVSSLLFSPDQDTVLVDKLRVNPIGGGSWMSEFESITGLDSRIFGYSGYYTHATVAPYIKSSFARYLVDKGYETSAYYPWPGVFFSARTAYGFYGFQKFADNSDLKLQDLTDASLVSEYIADLKTPSDRPIYSYFVLAENHAPHPCTNFKSAADLTVTLLGNSDFDINCPLNEFVRRERSTEQAVLKVKSFLQDLQAKTGRPYVLAIFGDHQPHTFTSTGGNLLSPFNYAPYRKDGGSLHETFVHIWSSVDGVLNCCEKPVPLNLLPSLLSGFVSDQILGMYLPVNFYLYSQCGADSFPYSGLLGLNWGSWGTAGSGAVATTECAAGIEKTLSKYRALKVVGSLILPGS